MDASTKVTCLLDGIQTDSLDAVKVIIMQDSELGRDFEMCITFYKYFIKRSSGNHGKETSRVGEVGFHSNSNYDVEYRYYLKEEYKKISTNAKEKLRKLCKGVHQVKIFEEEVIEEKYCTKISESLSNRQRSCSTPSRS